MPAKTEITQTPAKKVAAVKKTPAKSTITIDSAGQVVASVAVAGQTSVKETDLSSFLTKLGPRILSDTELMPPGVRLIRQGGQDMMMVIVQDPAINHVLWGSHEHDPRAKWYELAQPYRVIVGHWHQYDASRGWAFQGARHFYSPTVIGTSLDVPLYAVNVANTNLRGYGNTGVGWICFYHTDPPSKSIPKLAQRLIMRAGGSEPYNVANMSHTDGPGFYKGAGKPKFTWDRTEWDVKSLKEGVDWTLDPDLWIPLLVTGRDSQLEHNPNGVPLTLEMVVNGKAPFYYRDLRERDCNRQLTSAELYQQCTSAIN